MKVILESALNAESGAGLSAGSGLFAKEAESLVTGAFHEAVLQAKKDNAALKKSSAQPSSAVIKKARVIALQIHDLEGQLRAVLKPSAALADNAY